MSVGSSGSLYSFSFSEEHLALVESVEGYLSRLGSKRQELLNDIFEKGEYPDELSQAMVDLGLFGALIPAQYGGSGLGLLGMALAMEKFASFGLANTLALLTTMDAMAIQRGGTEDQKQLLLPQIAEGKIKSAFAITEADAGTNSFRIALSAKETGDGGFVLNGEKAWITGVDRADHLLVVSRTTSYQRVKESGLPKSFGMSLFFIDTATKGITKSKMATMGIEGFNQFQLFFDDVEVPKDALIGEKDLGAAVLFEALNPERIIAASFAVGMVDYFLSKSVNYANERRVFSDTPIGSYQAVQHPLAKIRVTQEGARLLTYQAASAFDQNAPMSIVARYANMAKYLASEVGFEAADRAIQTHGGNGFVRDFGIIQMLAPARLAKTAPINNEMILNFIAEHELKLPRSY
ncbi:MAG: acyl-CoA/acyl-ACP dehydrogenase [Acidimicrobiaceae bacterium]|nr:acyl-CoA/acyl-ACP dehydrogenase [Acidimicrobiaceae bacterium]